MSAPTTAPFAQTNSDVIATKLASRAVRMVILETESQSFGFLRQLRKGFEEKDKAYKGAYYPAVQSLKKLKPSNLLKAGWTPEEVAEALNNTPERLEIFQAKLLRGLDRFLGQSSKARHTMMRHWDPEIVRFTRQPILHHLPRRERQRSF